MSLKIIDCNENINISYSETSDKLWKKEVIKNDIYKFEESEKILGLKIKYIIIKPTISPFTMLKVLTYGLVFHFMIRKTVEDYEPEGLILMKRHLLLI